MTGFDLSSRHGILLKIRNHNNMISLFRWLVLFVPFDIFNNIVNFEMGDTKPFLLIINFMTVVRQINAVEAGT